MWSFVFLDDAGNQVGTGVSQAYTNNDATNPASAVAIEITEIAETISATTRFPRDDTTGWSSSAGGYMWSPQITDSGTLADKGIQEVTGMSVSTLAGAAGVVWEQGDEFYVRGVPTAPAPAGRSRWGRRPAAATRGGRSCSSTRSRTAGSPATTCCSSPIPARRLSRPSGHARPGHRRARRGTPRGSAGTFELEVSAAALHSSGRVVAVNTDSGRLGIVLPAVPPEQTPPAFPPVATYTAGSGTQIGLLSSPTAVAVTNPGTILVLEPGALQVSAFDLNGNPVRYFVTGPTGVAGTQFTLSLVNKGSYLDLAVDGSDQLYLLYYTGDGSAPADYCVDVYSPLGVLVAGGISGVNVPHFAVDYWRNIFAANYDALADTVTGQAHVDPLLAVAEPSLSVFSPDNSATATRLRRRRRRRRRRKG